MSRPTFERDFDLTYKRIGENMTLLENLDYESYASQMREKHFRRKADRRSALEKSIMPDGAAG